MYGYPWHELPNPFGFAESGTTLEQLAQRLLTKPEESAEVYGRIQNRGMAQVLFRQALLAAYGWRCAFCGLSLGAALQAAHIIPWPKATAAQRLDPRNGLLLCATHHALFDADILTVTPTGGSRSGPADGQTGGGPRRTSTPRCLLPDRAYGRRPARICGLPSKLSSTGPAA